MRRELWSGPFRLQGMKNPGPRMRMLDGFNEGWIEFQDRGCKAIKGQTSAVAVIAALVAEMHPLCAAHDMQPDIPVHPSRRDIMMMNRRIFSTVLVTGAAASLISARGVAANSTPLGSRPVGLVASGRDDFQAEAL